LGKQQHLRLGKFKLQVYNPLFVLATKTVCCPKYENKAHKKYKNLQVCENFKSEVEYLFSISSRLEDSLIRLFNYW